MCYIHFIGQFFILFILKIIIFFQKIKFNSNFIYLIFKFLACMASTNLRHDIIKENISLGNFGDYTFIIGPIL